MPDILEQLNEQWEQILLHLKEEHELLDVSYKTWLLPLKVSSVEGTTVNVLAPDANFVTYIRKKYGFLLQVTIEEVTGFACTVEFITKDEDQDQSKHLLSASGDVKSAIPLSFPTKSSLHRIISFPYIRSWTSHTSKVSLYSGRKFNSFSSLFL